MEEDGRENMRVLRADSFNLMCINGFWQTWGMLMTSKWSGIESGSPFCPTGVFLFVKMGEKGTKKNYFQTAYFIDVHRQH